MSHRDLTVSFLGVAAGVVLGAGSALLSGTNSLAANAQPIPTTPGVFHAAPDASDYTRRKIERRGIPMYGDTDVPNRYPSIQGYTSSSVASSSAASGATDGITVCTAVRRSVDKLKQVYNSVVPDTIKNTELRQAMDSAFADVADDYCETASTSASAANAAVGTVDNDCEKYPKRTIRYSQCVIAEEHGVKYPE